LAGSAVAGAIDASIAIHAAAPEKALGQDPDSWRFAACCRTSGRTPPSSGRRRSSRRFRGIVQSALTVRLAEVVLRFQSLPREPRRVRGSFLGSADSRPAQAVQLFDEMGRQRGGRRPFLRALIVGVPGTERRPSPETPWVGEQRGDPIFDAARAPCTRNSRSRCGRFASSLFHGRHDHGPASTGIAGKLCGQGREGARQRPAGRF